jgi:2'-5' RNA ligase
MMRLFIALPLPKPAEEELGRIITLLEQKGGRVKWVDPKNIHLTARFLGDTEERLVDDLSSLIDNVAGQFNPVASAINQLGAFPNLRRPRVIWVSLQENIEVLAKIAGQVELAVRELRFKKEPRQFKPHLTLGRVKDTSSLENLTSYIQDFTLQEIPVTFDRLTLFKSTLTPQGPIYDRLHEAMLGRE